MATPRKTCIHLGLPKTATTSIRFNLFAKHSQIHYLGKFLGGEVPPAISHVILKHWRMLIISLVLDAPRSRNAPDLLVDEEKENQTPVLSMESLSGGPLLVKRLQAKRFKKYFGDCQAILFVREPSSFLKSFYAQMLRNFQERPTGTCPVGMRTLGRHPHYFDINEWLQAAWNGINSPKNYISYADTAGIYADVFGKENVKILVFEEMIRNPEAFITQLCNIIGVDPGEGVNLMHGKRSNERLTTDYIRRLQEIEQSEILTEQFLNATPEARRKLLESKECTGEKISPQLSEKWLKKINAVGDKQNRQLIQEWGLPLADYGYRH